MERPEDYITIAITLLPSQIASVYALLGGTSVVAVATAPLGNVAAAQPVIQSGSENIVLLGSAGSAGTGETAPTVASPSEPDVGAPDVDAHGWPWSAELHASTKGTTKDGLWRMKIGVTRPAPKPGFPIAGSTSTEVSGSVPSATPSASAETASSPAATNDDDEFAAFRAAAAKSDAEDAAAKAAVPARKWTDADLGALCNQAAVKLGDPAPVKEIIAKFVPEGVVAHSRNVPEDQRQAFAEAIEAKAGIEFAG